MSAFLIFILTILLALIITHYVQQYFRVWRFIEKIPGPKTFPIVGNILQLGFTPEENLDSLLRIWYHYGCDKYRAWLLNKPFVIISDPKDVEQVLCSNELLDKSFVYDTAKPWLGESLIRAEVPKWRKFRKIINQSFHFKVLIEYLEVMDRCSNTFVKELSKYANSEELFDLQELASYFSLDVLCESVFGIPFSSSAAENSEIISTIKESTELGFRRVFSIFKRFDFFYKFTSDYKRYLELKKIFTDYVSEIVSKRRKLLEKEIQSVEDNSDPDLNVKQKKAVLDNLLTAKVDNRPVTFQEIYYEISAFLIAGHDTIVSALIFGTYILSRFPEVQNKIFEEQLHIFGDDMKRNITFEDIQEMQYLDWFIKETLRIFPSAPLIARKVTEPFYLGEYKIPAETTIVPFIYGMGRNEKYFKDPLKFDPTRFSPENRVNSSPYDTIPFSAGPRNCVGHKFSIFELKTAFSKIIRNYEILPPYEKCCDKIPGHSHNVFDKELQPPILKVGITIMPKDKIELKLKHRKKL